MKRSPILRKTPLRAKKQWRPIRKPMRKVSKRRAKESKIRNAQWPAFLEAHPNCEVKSEVCTGKTECRHHRLGRTGSRFLEAIYQEASCFRCNDFLETARGKKWGYAKGHRLDRLAKNSEIVFASDCPCVGPNSEE